MLIEYLYLQNKIKTFLRTLISERFLWPREQFIFDQYLVRIRCRCTPAISIVHMQRHFAPFLVRGIRDQSSPLRPSCLCAEGNNYVLVWGGSTARPSWSFLPRDVSMWTCSTSSRRQSALIVVLRRRPRRPQNVDGGVYTTSSWVEDAAPVPWNAPHQVSFIYCLLLLFLSPVDS